MKTMFKLLAVSLVALVPFFASAQGNETQDMNTPTILRKSGSQVQTIKCHEIEGFNPNGGLKYKRNASDRAVQIIPKAELVYIFNPRKNCKDLVAADNALNAGKFADALKALDKAKPQYANMGWDANIAYLRGLCLYNLNRKDEAVTAWTEVMRIKTTGIASWKNDDVDLALGMLAIAGGETKNEKAVTQVAEFVKNRQSTAFQGVLIAQGDIARAKGDRRSAVFQYMKAALLYKNPTLTPRALCMANNTMKELGDARGAKFGNILKEEYPNSEWISRLK